MTFKAAILANEMKEDHIGWVRACSKYKQAIECKVIDLTAFDWLEKVKSEPFDVFLAKPGGFTERFKNLYDERCYIIENELGLFLYPSLKEILIYENKRLLSYWLSAHGIPHPRTYVFYNEAEALEFARTAGFPVMAKYNIGGSGSGVPPAFAALNSARYLLKRSIAPRYTVAMESQRRLQTGGSHCPGILHPEKLFC